MLLISSQASSQICLTLVALTVLVVANRLDIAELSSIPASFSSHAGSWNQYVDLDTLLKVFITAFMVQLCMLIGFQLYCDCAYAVWLEIKIAVFYVIVGHLAATVSIMSELLCFELIGLLSFRLVGHFLHRLAAFRGAYIAVGANKVGDFLLVLWICRSLTAYPKMLFSDPLILEIVLLSLAVKSISVLSFLWLPDAMEGPTPVSALLHSATLVLSGVLVFARSIASVQCSTVILLLVVGFVLVCCSYSLDPDAKKISAISTCLMVSLIWIELSVSPCSG